MDAITAPQSRYRQFIEAAHYRVVSYAYYAPYFIATLVVLHILFSGAVLLEGWSPWWSYLLLGAALVSLTSQFLGEWFVGFDALFLVITILARLVIVGVSVKVFAAAGTAVQDVLPALLLLCLVAHIIGVAFVAWMVKSCISAFTT